MGLSLGPSGNDTMTDLEDLGIDSSDYSDCYESDSFRNFQYTVDDLLLAACTAATVFNVIVIFCAMKLFKRSGDTMHLFIINMTIGDLLLTVFCHPNEFLIRKHEFLRHVHLCAVIHFCNWLGLAVSGLSLTLLNVDKLIYFQWPYRYDQTMSKRRAAFLCIFIWCLSFGFVSYVWMGGIVYVTQDCMLQMAEQKKYYYEIFMIMFCVLPVTSSLFVSIYLFRLTRQKRNAPVTMSNNQIDIKNKLKSLVFIFATTAWTSFSLLPYRIFNICRIHLFEWSAISCETREVMNWLAWMLLYLLTTNPIVNPLITAIIYAPYRMTIKRLMINLPIGNRPHSSHYRNEHTETSFLSSARQNQKRRARHGQMEQELSEMSSSYKGSVGELVREQTSSFNGHISDGFSLDEAEEDVSSAQSQPAPSSQPECSRQQRPQSATFRSNSCNDL
ncbi:unnamed protein product [Bursaphelenchus xylophilus]|uniref:(pine wood nematode) hypothetical protein n=1 Tax=Bursaphelenchus xylophilus TaxID=6326 RepID=A0A1I7RRG2_BURXY|nr:unnamed protein product [Bursaphelenchus xylophilus]CAG9131016.1 unnamed protein product [Bursaphelenchus xylophilus]